MSERERETERHRERHTQREKRDTERERERERDAYHPIKDISNRETEGIINRGDSGISSHSSGERVVEFSAYRENQWQIRKEGSHVACWDDIGCLQGFYKYLEL